MIPYLNTDDSKKSTLIFRSESSQIVFIKFIRENKSSQKKKNPLKYVYVALCGLFLKMFKVHTKVFDLTDICKYSRKFQLFNMCGSQDIAKASLNQISFKVKCY